jgi:hypothetical protein
MWATIGLPATLRSSQRTGREGVDNATTTSRFMGVLVKLP